MAETVARVSRSGVRGPYYHPSDYPKTRRATVERNNNIYINLGDETFSISPSGRVSRRAPGPLRLSFIGRVLD